MNQEIMKFAETFPDIAQAMRHDIVPEFVIETF